MDVSPEEFRHVPMCETAKEVWNILKTTHERTIAVKNSKLKMLTTRFKEIKMRNDESFDNFYAKLNDMVNSNFNLSGRISEVKIVRKVMRSLREKFRSKRDLCKAMNTTFTDDESSSNNQSEKSSHDETEKYMAFIVVVKNKSLEDKEKSDRLQEGSEDKRDICEAFDELFQDCLKLEKVK
ncbi:unnamed protein product [Fraxinus pennsylvanica]|uniref:Uncharacterized protein n=1 Tax=Fraxinus pennsylvanica TaxID=56036 RepID=A0AAD1Z5W2_9LAMI|nr:unnamed protein product [Fraxinus pennsylvanica]